MYYYSLQIKKIGIKKNIYASKKLLFSSYVFTLSENDTFLFLVSWVDVSIWPLWDSMFWFRLRHIYFYVVYLYDD
jgi:hypothetical protein